MVSDSTEGSNEDADQYDVTIWEERTRLDHLAVGVSQVIVRWWVALAAIIGALLVAHPLVSIRTE
ncbi:hypothetical protein [Natrialba asiatica]|uniref:Uncharacterized protein n=1 Tax=Natrialba asiatica (strain ATCC 700177 / DSM 12278 / JCM 9576 / FERM P-10747 / NBRC 102637 / 172P1) TaxID=29540 RepID=M0AZU1_NATA1|nr:hypothetical protein [Natrialba asiatica]ELZ03483.1 hypothetical protein C481_05800 [Natrialba asiatica DSM 12278]